MHSAADALEVGLAEVVPRAPRELALEEGEGEERGVPLVDVVLRIVGVAQCVEHCGAAHAEHDLLAQPVMAVAAVEGIGERAIPLGVLVEVRVEEEDGDDVAAGAHYVIAPGADLDAAAGDLDGGSGGFGGEHLLGLPLHLGFVLLPVRVQRLREVALSVQKGDGDHGNVEIGGGAKGVTGENAESATVRWDRLLEADLHGEVGDDGAGRNGHEAGSRLGWSKGAVSYPLRRNRRHVTRTIRDLAASSSP